VRGTTGFLLGAIVLAVAGALCYAAGTLDRELAHAAEHFATMDYETPLETFETAEPYLALIRPLPRVGAERVNDVRVRKAAAQYYQGNYESVLPDQADPAARSTEDNLQLQLIAAHAVYRSGHAQAKDRQTLVQAIDAGIAAYLSVLKNATRHEQAAFNYELLIRLRDEAAKARGKPDLTPKPQQPLGLPGTASRASSAGEFKILVPLDNPERDQNATAGKAAPLKRKG
jgi:hypothetical protein